MSPDAPASLRWGILATGRIAHSFVSDIRAAGLDVQAVGSRRREAAEAFAHEFDIPRAHGSYEALAADPDVDIVYVATPHPMHAANALLMIEHGKHVLVEKPFTLNAAQASAVRDAAAARGVLAMEAMWTRYLPMMVRLREIVASGVLGRIRVVTADHTQAISDDPAHRLNALDLGGGALLDLGVYPVSFVHGILGTPRSVQASGYLKATGADAEVATIFTYGSGAIATTLSSSMAVGPNRAAVVGERARIEIDPVWYRATTFRLIAADGEVLEEYVSDIQGKGMQFQALAAERLVADGTLAGDELTIDESVQIMGVLDDVRAQIGVVYPGED